MNSDYCSGVPFVINQAIKCEIYMQCKVSTHHNSSHKSLHPDIDVHILHATPQILTCNKRENVVYEQNISVENKLLHIICVDLHHFEINGIWY